MKFADTYEMITFRDGVYVFVVYKNRDVTYGVWVDLTKKEIDISKDEITNYISNTKEYQAWINELYDELKALSDSEIRNLIQSKLSLNKFKL